MTNVHGINSLKTSPSKPVNQNTTTKRKSSDRKAETLEEESPAKQARVESEDTVQPVTAASVLEKCAFDDDQAEMKRLTLKSPNGRYICPAEACEQVSAKCDSVK